MDLLYENYVIFFNSIYNGLYLYFGYNIGIRALNQNWPEVDYLHCLIVLFTFQYLSNSVIQRVKTEIVTQMVAVDKDIFISNVLKTALEKEAMKDKINE